MALFAASVLLLVQLAGPAAASAKRGLITGTGDDYIQPSTRDDLFDRTEEAGAELVRILVGWRVVAGTRPANPRDPADPAYDFSGVDGAVRTAQARGFDIMFTVANTPEWAEGPNRPEDAPKGTWDPNPAAYGDFGHALARRYSGGFRPAGAGPLPRVRHFEVWNEANLPHFLTPQWVDGSPRSPTIYRALLNAFYEGVHAAHDDNAVIGGGLAPYGRPDSQMRPLHFLRKLFCLKGRRKLKPKRCPPVKMDVLSHHPISTSGGPRRSALHPDDAPTADIGKVKRVLRAAEKGHNVKPGGRRPLWATEFWWQSDPPVSSKKPLPFGGVPLKKHARWIQEALYLFWKHGVSTAIYYDVRDRQPGVETGPFSQTGLFLADGTAKPAVQAYRFPFVTQRRNRKRIQAWGKAPRSGRLVVERQRRGKWRKVKRIKAREGKVFTTGVRLRNGARLRARIGEEQSLPWRQRR